MIKSLINKSKQLYRVWRKLNQLKKEPIEDINAKPKVLNLNIIDSCNSKCTMCNIWRRDEQLEITPEQLGTVLSNTLYENLEHVGVTGGEPTLRTDLPQVFMTIIETLPKLKGVSIITNAINLEEVKSRIKEVNDVCKLRNIPFSAMVSIDGVGEVHDRVRGTKGNFETAISLFKYLKNELNIPTSFGCTISKVNAWDAEDLMHYAIDNDMYGRFRIAENINRLYNQNRGKVIRNFSEDETYNLVLFFEKLKQNFESNSTYIRTYSSIQNMLLGGDRLIGCPYHKKGIVLGSKGQINYCAPKGTDIGNGIYESSTSVYKNNYSEKVKILKNDCKDCIHDYHAPVTYNEYLIELKKKFYRKLLHIRQINRINIIAKFLKKIPKYSNRYRVFILGWYGTETVGDKAILGGIIDYYNKIYGKDVEYVIGSLYPFISEQTCKELEIEATVVSTQTFDLLRYAKSSDEIVMGGGPLMDLNELYVPYFGFKIAKAYKKNTTIFGCGIGPLKNKIFNTTVKEILKLSNEIKLRDKKSIEIYKNYGLNGNVEYTGDPAIGYIKKIEKNISTHKKNVLTCYLREWTFEYYIGEKHDFEIDKEKLEDGIAHLIKLKADELNVEKIEFHHMHNFVVGNDDRDFSRYFTNKYFINDERVFVNKKLSTVNSIVTSMKQSRLNICMRFHSVLFAETLNTDFIAIDYTFGGKINQFLKDKNKIEKMLTIQNLINNEY